MGDKYLPTRNDLKATKRFQQSLSAGSKFIRPATKKIAPVVAKKDTPQT